RPSSPSARASSTRSSTTLPATACRSQRTWTTRMPPPRSPARSLQPSADSTRARERLAPTRGRGALDVRGDVSPSGARLAPRRSTGVQRQLLGIDGRDQLVHDLLAEVA